MHQQYTTVFIIDDNQAICDSLDWLLSPLSLRVETFQNAEDFLFQFLSILSKWTTQNKACLILDLHLPGMSGVDLLKTLDQQQIDLPVIVVSGRLEMPRSQCQFYSNLIDFMKKPVDSELLLKRICDTLDFNPLYPI